MRPFVIAWTLALFATSVTAQTEPTLDHALHALADDMRDCERWIDGGRTGPRTQETQVLVIAALARLVDAIEESEKQSPNSGQPATATRPADRSSAPRVEPQPSGRRRETRGGATERWHVLTERQRQQVRQDVRARIPAKYRRLLEEYYRRLGRVTGWRREQD